MDDEQPMKEELRAALEGVAQTKGRSLSYVLTHIIKKLGGMRKQLG